MHKNRSTPCHWSWIDLKWRTGSERGGTQPKHLQWLLGFFFHSLIIVRQLKTLSGFLPSARWKPSSPSLLIHSPVLILICLIPDKEFSSFRKHLFLLRVLFLHAWSLSTNSVTIVTSATFNYFLMCYSLVGSYFKHINNCYLC